MKLKMRKIKSWLRWGKKRYEEKYNIKVEKMIFSKSQLLMVQNFYKQEHQQEKEFIKNGGHIVKLKDLRGKIE